MRAKKVLKIAYVMDFDDTLVTTDAKTHVLDKDSGQHLFSLTPDEFNTYSKKIMEIGKSLNLPYVRN